MDTQSGDQLLQELATAPVEERTRSAPTMGNLQKLRYTHEAMVDLIVQNPAISQGQIAAAFGYTQAWVSNILASDAFQERLAARREAIVDPVLRLTLEERFRALTQRSLEVLMEKLHKPQVSDTVALRAAELGARALNIGGQNKPPELDPNRLLDLAQNLVQLQSKVKGTIYDQETKPVAES